MSQDIKSVEGGEIGAIRPLHRELYEAARLNQHFFTLRTLHLTTTPCDETRQDEHPIECSNIYRTFKLGTVLFSAVTLEALINFYAKQLDLQSYAENERIPTLKKWRIYPKLAHGNQVPEHVLQRIDLVFKLRDRVAHPKPRTETVPRNVRIFTPCEGAYMVNSVHVAAQALDNCGNPDPSRNWIQKDIDPAWQPDVDILF